MAGDIPSKPSAAQAPAPKVFNCPSCGAGIVLRALGQTVSVACRSCGSVIDAANENYKVLSKAAKQLKIEPLIPLGQRGKLHGVLWEVIGLMQRCDGSGVYCWREYLLYNPTRGFRWLTEFDGHWNYVVTTKEKPTTDTGLTGRNIAKYMGKHYHLFHKGTAKVTFVLGEFYWRVQVDEKVHVEDYVLPPEILSCERSKDEVIWSVGEYIDPDHIRTAFQIAKPMPVQSGVAPNQPSTVSSLAPAVGKYWGIFIAIIIAIQFLTMITAKNEQAYRGDFEYRSTDTEKVKVSPQFELKHGLSNVEFQLYSPVQNNWLEIQADLVNDQTGETYEFEQGVEYYSGYDSDGSWTEGSQINSKVLSSIPAGLYHLNIEAAGPSSSSTQFSTAPYQAPGQSFSVTVKRDVVTWSNFLWAFALVSLFPALVWWRNRSFEMNRWSQSDFSSYYSHQEDE